MLPSRSIKSLLETRQEKIIKRLDVKKNSDLKKISVSDARFDKKNPDDKNYWSILDLAYQKNAAVTLQRAFRKKHQYEYKNKSTKTEPITMRFMQEPTDKKYLEHVNKIQNCDWLGLDYNDPQFVRNIYKALRLGLIDSYKLATVSLWYYAIDFLRNKNDEVRICQYSFVNKGPYDPASVSYANPKMLDDFYNELKKLPEGERGYLTIDMPKEHEVVFLLIMMIRLHEQGDHYRPLFKIMLEKFIKQINIPIEKKSALLELLPTIWKIGGYQKLLDFLTEQFFTVYPDDKPKEDVKIDEYVMKLAKDTKDRKLFDAMNNYLLLVAILIVNQQNPTLVLSPDYNEVDINSPIISFVLPTLSAWMALQKSVHQESAAYPTLTVGQLSPHDFLANFKKSLFSRFIELVHPDVKHNEKPHEVYTTPFILSWHDYQHVWCNGSIMHKFLFMHLINSLSDFTNIKMSQAIWKLIDMDTGLGRAVRDAEKKGELVEEYRIDYLFAFLNRLEISLHDFFDFSLLIAIDMVINREEWKKSLGKYPEDFFPKDDDTWLKIMGKEKELSHFNFSEFQSMLTKMAEIIRTNPIKNPVQASIVYILLYRFKDYPEGLMLVDKIRKIGVEKFFTLKSNKIGIHIFVTHSCVKESILPISKDNLFSSLKNLIERHIENEETLPLAQACDKGNVELVKSLIEKQPKLINQVFSINEFTPLYESCAKGQLNVVNLLLECKADVNKPIGDKCTSLIVAAFFGHQDVVMSLLKNNADPNVVFNQKTAFEWAKTHDIKRLILRAQIESELQPVNLLEEKSTSPGLFSVTTKISDVVSAKKLLTSDLNPEDITTSDPVLSVLLERAKTLPKIVMTCHSVSKCEMTL